MATARIHSADCTPGPRWNDLDPETATTVRNLFIIPPIVFPAGSESIVGKGSVVEPRINERLSAPLIGFLTWKLD
jgi:hypothetical protein